MPATPKDWADPFFKQACEDLRAAWSISREKSPSTFCMLLQMVFEKLGKAGYARAGNIVPQTHRTASHLLTILRRHPAAKSIPQANIQVFQFIQELEAAHPSVAKLFPQPFPQLEFPWEDPNPGKVYCPCEDLPLAKRICNPKDRIALDALKLASALEKKFYSIFP